MKISNYDQFEYDYSTYWKNRNYEHFAEVLSLKKLLKDIKGDWFLDVGGSFGRHLTSYSSLFKNCVIVDYSLNTLINNKDRIMAKYPNTHLIAANVYYLPFKDNIFDGAAMIRVLHHLQEPNQYFKEIVKTLRNNAIYIQEFANKIHAKASIRHIIKGDFKFFNPDPFQQPTLGNMEGSKGEESIFLNYHPQHINSILLKYGFVKKQKINTSFFRIPIIKKIIPFQLLILLESTLQSILSWTNIAPSIFLKLKLKKKQGKSFNYTEIQDILVCPKCKNELNFKKEECICTSCKRRYEKVVGIWDFRIQE